MTLRTVDELQCQCGHRGVLRSAENDQPYSTHWVRHSLEGFLGSVSDWQLANVMCPACGQTGKVDYANRT